MPIKFIYGMSGCAKTTTAIKLLIKLNTENFNCIAFTHSAVNNLKEKYKENYEQAEIDLKVYKPFNPDVLSNFKTIHKFLRIPITENGNYTIIKHQMLQIKSLIIVDEFSLIPLNIINYLFEIATDRVDINFIFVGDFIQLMPISEIREPINLNLLT